MSNRSPSARSRWALTLLAASIAVVALALSANAVLAHAANPWNTGPELHALGCSRDDRYPPGLVTNRISAYRVLVPGGAVSVTICEYNGMNPLDGTPQFGLLRQGVISSLATLKRLATMADALKPTKPGTVYNCPFSDGTEYVLRFRYPQGAADILTDDAMGCGEISNGHVFRNDLSWSVSRRARRITEPVHLSWAALSGTVAPAIAAGRAQAVNSSGEFVAMAQIAHHRFRFGIATPGSYTIELMGTGAKLNTVIAREPASVSVGQTTRVRFRFTKSR